MKINLRGFGTVEIIILLLIFSLLSVLMIPTFKRYQAHQELLDNTEVLQQTVMIAQKKTLISNHPVILCPSLDHQTCTTRPNATAFIAFIDENDDAKLSLPDQMIEVLDFTSSGETISYKGFPYNKMHVLSPDNRINSNGTFKLTSVKTQESFEVRISKSGNIQVIHL